MGARGEATKSRLQAAADVLRGILPADWKITISRDRSPHVFVGRPRRGGGFLGYAFGGRWDARGRELRAAAAVYSCDCDSCRSCYGLTDDARGRLARLARA